MSALVSVIDANRARATSPRRSAFSCSTTFAPKLTPAKVWQRRGRTRRVDLKKSLARNLRRLRAARGLSQTVLAAKAGITRPHLSRLENRTYDTGLDTVSKLAAALGSEPLDLLK